MIKLKNIDQKNLADELQSVLDKYSSKELTTQEIANLHSRDENVKFYLSLLKKFKTSSSSTQEQFEQSITEFMSRALSNKDIDELHQILLIYLLLTAPYILDFFNTQKLSNKKKHIKNLKQLFIDMTTNVIKTYEDRLERTLKEIESKK